jgi:hypothetical protein
MPSAIGRSKRPLSFGRSAGARLTVMRLLCGNSKPLCGQRGAHALARLLHLGVGQAHQREARQAVGQVHLDPHLGRPAVECPAHHHGQRHPVPLQVAIGSFFGPAAAAASTAVVRTLMGPPVWGEASLHTVTMCAEMGRGGHRHGWHRSCNRGCNTFNPPGALHEEKLCSLAVAMAATAVPTVSYADMAFNAGVVTDYRYRGISQTRLKPAVQGGVDFSSGGFYLGAWASTIKWVKDGGGDADVEIDLYGGYKGELAKDLGYDVGVLTYHLPEQQAQPQANTTEIYGALTFGPATAKYSHSGDQPVRLRRQQEQRLLRLSAPPSTSAASW